MGTATGIPSAKGLRHTSPEIRGCQARLATQPPHNTMQTSEYQVTLTVSLDEVETLKAALLAYSKSKAVTLENFDLVRELYGKIGPAWSRRTQEAK